MKGPERMKIATLLLVSYVAIESPLRKTKDFWQKRQKKFPVLSLLQRVLFPFLNAVTRSPFDNYAWF